MGEMKNPSGRGKMSDKILPNPPLRKEGVMEKRRGGKINRKGAKETEQIISLQPSFSFSLPP